MSINKKNILLYAFKSDDWIGGIYYIRNVAMQISTNENIIKSHDIYIYTLNGNYKYYKDLEDKVIIRYFEHPLSLFNLLRYYIRDGIKYIFPSTRKRVSLYLKRIDWIPDFQDSKLPSNFSNEEIQGRNRMNRFLAMKGRKVVLSSKDCKNDFVKYYSPIDAKVYVMPFISYIEPEIRRITKDKEEETLNKFSLINIKYAVVMNQFWQHKNHLVVFEAIKILAKHKNNINYKFVFTGRMEDYRNPNYIEVLKNLASETIVADHIMSLGFIDRDEQVIIMKNAEYVIQPSLSEGWGTVVEDAKVLDKTVLLSDVPVHREQMNEKCILFNPHDSVALAELISEECRKEHHDDIEKGIATMYRCAKEYSKGFEQLLCDLEKN